MSASACRATRVVAQPRAPAMGSTATTAVAAKTRERSEARSSHSHSTTKSRSTAPPSSPTRTVRVARTVPSFHTATV